MKLKLKLLNCLLFASISNLHCSSKEKLIHNAIGYGYAILSAGSAGLACGTVKEIYEMQTSKKYYAATISIYSIITSLLSYGSYKTAKAALHYFKNQPKEPQAQDARVTKS